MSNERELRKQKGVREMPVTEMLATIGFAVMVVAWAVLPMRARR